MNKKDTLKIIRSVALTGFVFGLLGWVYIALVALVHPETLTIQLTHFASFPREDTFGIICFVFSGVCFFVWRLAKEFN